MALTVNPIHTGVNEFGDNPQAAIVINLFLFYEEGRAVRIWGWGWGGDSRCNEQRTSGIKK